MHYEDNYTRSVSYQRTRSWLIPCWLASFGPKAQSPRNSSRSLFALKVSSGHRSLMAEWRSDVLTHQRYAASPRTAATQICTNCQKIKAGVDIRSIFAWTWGFPTNCNLAWWSWGRLFLASPWLIAPPTQTSYICDLLLLLCVGCWHCSL